MELDLHAVAGPRVARLEGRVQRLLVQRADRGHVSDSLCVSEWASYNEAHCTPLRADRHPGAAGPARSAREEQLLEVEAAWKPFLLPPASRLQVGESGCPATPVADFMESGYNAPQSIGV